jgi:hypothetical protein
MVATITKGVQVTSPSTSPEGRGIRERIGDAQRNRLQQAIAENRLRNLADLLQITTEDCPQTGFEQFYRSVNLSETNVRRMNEAILDGSITTLPELIETVCETASAECKASEANRIVPFGVRLSTSGRIEEDDSLEISGSSLNFTLSYCGIAVPDGVAFDGLDP